jgi:small subunit ribosomal protein S20
LANTKSAEKRNRQAHKRNARNVQVRTTVKTALKRAREAIASKDPAKAREAVRMAASALSKAKSKGVLHAQNASRRIARLSHQLHAIVGATK